MNIPLRIVPGLRMSARSVPLVIVISAFKHQFLEQTLESLADQTCNNFDVFVGDDCGPHQIEAICSKFSERLNLTFHRFRTNLGGISLAKQWDRCIALTDNPWIMLLGDDDMLDPDCVRSFYEAVQNRQQHSKLPLYRFDTRIIDANGNLIRENPEHASQVNSLDFLSGRFQGKSSYVVEVIFPRALHTEICGFVELPLAWGSDDASWAKMALGSSIKCIKGPRVSWRLSGENISSTKRELAPIKIMTQLRFLEWANDEIFSTFDGNSSAVKDVRSQGVEWFLSGAEEKGAVVSFWSLPGIAHRLASFSGESRLPLLWQLLKMKLRSLLGRPWQ